MDIRQSQALQDRVKDILAELHSSNGEYALAKKSAAQLYSFINPIINPAREITICAGNCCNFQEYLNAQTEMTDISQKHLYQQGFIDCVKLMLQACASRCTNCAPPLP